ncbi:MAG TPA: hypothetical protein VJZ06_10585 [Mobilitalea sp.]|nr:hypothetical protein [Mobilitalea sp.]
MQLLVLILKNNSLVEVLIKKLAKSGVRGGTILDGTGMAQELMNMEDLPIFGMLRALLADENKVTSKVMLFALKDEQVAEIRGIIKNLIGSLDEPNTGIMFSVPINGVEGLGE